MRKDIKELKREFIGLMVFGIFVSFLAIVLEMQTRIYPETAIITNIEKQDEVYLIEFTLSNGNVYEYESEDGDCLISDFYSILFYDNGTQNVKDDKIIKIKYCGF